GLNFLRSRNYAITNRGELRLSYPCSLGGILGKGSCSFAVSLAMIPPFYEVASFRMIFVIPTDEDAVFSHSPLGVEQGRGKDPLVVDFDLLEEFYAR
ncbi:MAG: hypothetical protein WBW31_04715, partial [Candidatus Sulfotelmatobacter sp.]